MADIGELRYLYTGRIEERDGSYVIEVPQREVAEGELETGESSQIGVFGPVAEGDAAETTQEASTGGTSDGEELDDGATGDTGPAGEGSVTTDTAETGTADGSGGIAGTESLDEVEVRDPQEPPVDEGETRTVEIEDEGEQGDGLARIDRGYIVFVPGTEPGDTVEIRITETKENFAFGETVE